MPKVSRVEISEDDPLDAVDFYVKLSNIKLTLRALTADEDSKRYYRALVVSDYEDNPRTFLLTDGEIALLATLFDGARA